MRKLFKLKKWYTLEEAAARLTLNFSEQVSERDVIQMAADGLLKTCWFLKGEHLGRRVTVFCNYPKGEIPAAFSEPAYDKDGAWWGISLSGIFELPVEICPSWGWWLLTFIGQGGESGNWCGAVVIDEDGETWELYDDPGGNNFGPMTFPVKLDIGYAVRFYRPGVRSRAARAARVPA
ncbi:hypothetical protein F2P44_21660 [Massilia sp. CCM 8695]|uniref:Uncharacterized protein n=1 Tax=Massilia frigida TaxID=2609281 RepID=A0ABX0NGG7_9BURK|nr:hypothetical protein [Massilia frigida]NHZ81862.1 hypothetical protein [Massilia frigida]